MSVERKWTAEEIAKDDVSKKDIIAFLHGSYFLNGWKRTESHLGNDWMPDRTPGTPLNSTKMIIEHGAECFLAEKKVLGSAKNVAKKPKEVLIEAYEDLFKTGSFKGSEMDKVIEKIEKVEIKKEKHFLSPPVDGPT